VPATKIVNQGEVERWFREKRTYTWMIEEYRRKYNIDTTPSMWSGVRRRLGFDPRIVHDPDLIPWTVKEQHRWEFPLQMLRAEARRRQGRTLDPEYARKLPGFLQRLQDDNTVVHYDPDTDEGFFYVPRRPGVDTDLVRQPTLETGRSAPREDH
jgi:hypothetical protein